MKVEIGHTDIHLRNIKPDRVISKFDALWDAAQSLRARKHEACSKGRELIPLNERKCMKYTPRRDLTRALLLISSPEKTA